MLHLARLAIARPKAMLIAWALVAAALIAIGLGVSNSLSPSVVVVPGTESSRAETLAAEEFGPSILVPILLEGPADQLEAQGPRLVLDLSQRSDTRVMSAWSSGPAGPALRPKRTVAMVVASVARSEKAMVKTHQKAIEQLVARDIATPVRATVTGQPSIDRALRDRSLDATRTAELIAIGVLFVLLSFMLRSPLAGGVIALFGAATVSMSFGVLAIAGKIVDIDPLAVAIGSMSGLALGTGYALMMVRRFREEETPGRSRRDAAHAASTAVTSSGRAVLFGGTALVIALLLALVLSSVKVQMSLGIGVLTCTLLGIAGAVAVLPAVLVLAGHRLDVWRPTDAGVPGKAWGRLVGEGDQIVRRPVLIGALATAALVALAIPVTKLDTGPPGISMLPEDAGARQSFEHVSAVMGPGWATPYNVLVVAKDKPLTDRALLADIASFQRRIARDGRVDTVLGPGAFTTQSTDLKKLPKGLDQSAAVAKSSKRDLKQLQDGLGQAGAGAAQLRSGLSDAASGAGQLKSGSSAGQGGAGQLKDGLTKARSGARQISAGLASALAGAISLRDGAAKALAGSKQLQGGLTEANAPLSSGLPIARQMAADASTASKAIAAGKTNAQTTSGQIANALGSLQKTGGSDPNVQAAISALTTAKGAADELAASLGNASAPASSAATIAGAFGDQVAQLSAGVKQLLAGSTALAAGIAKLEKGNGDLASGLKKLNTGGGDLTSGLGQLEDGAAKLQSGLGQLTAGSGQLQSGLSGGVAPSGELVTGLGTMEAAVAKARNSVPSTKDLETLKAQSPGLFDSGYFVLAAIQGAPTDDRATASFALNVDRGGNAGQIVVVPKTGATTQATQDLGRTLRNEADAFADATGTKTAVGGPAGNLADYKSFGEAHVALVIIATALAIALLLGIALRAALLPAVAVAFNLLTVLATFGILSLLFDGSDPLLGGPGYLDPMSVIGIFAASFGFSVIYELLLLLRTREMFTASGDAHGALRHALRATAFSATGAGLVMIAVAVPFALTDLIGVRQFGLGVAIVVLLDILVVRPVLLPAATAVLGERGWWPTRGGTPAGPDTPPTPAERSGRFRRTEAPEHAPTT